MSVCALVLSRRKVRMERDAGKQNRKVWASVQATGVRRLLNENRQDAKAKEQAEQRECPVRKKGRGSKREWF